MRQLTKAEACRELAVSLSTLDRRIASGDIEVRREQHGRRHRVLGWLVHRIGQISSYEQGQDKLSAVTKALSRTADYPDTIHEAATGELQLILGLAKAFDKRHCKTTLLHGGRHGRPRREQRS